MQTHLSVLPPALLLLIAVSLAGCSKQEPVDEYDTPWNPQVATVRDAEGNVVEQSWDEDDCLALEGRECLSAEDACGGKAAAEVYLDENGEVAEVVCLPKETPQEILLLDGGEVPDIGNGTAVVIEGDEMNPAVEGDLDFTTNNVVIWGEDPATSVIDGGMIIDGNNALVSGVTLKGDVVINFNNASMSNCIIEGDLTLNGNDSQIVGCRISGNVVITGNNNELTLNSLAGTVENTGQNTVCTDNYVGDSLSEGEPVDCD